MRRMTAPPPRQLLTQNQGYTGKELSYPLLLKDCQRQYGNNTNMKIHLWDHANSSHIVHSSRWAELHSLSLFTQPTGFVLPHNEDSWLPDNVCTAISFTKLPKMAECNLWPILEIFFALNAFYKYNIFYASQNGCAMFCMSWCVHVLLKLLYAIVIQKWLIWAGIGGIGLWSRIRLSSWNVR